MRASAPGGRRALRSRSGRGLLLVGAPLLALALLVRITSPSPEETGPALTATREAMSAMQQIAGLRALSADPEANAAAAHPVGTFSKAADPELFRLTPERIPAAQEAGGRRLATYFTGPQLAWFSTVNQAMPERYAGLTVAEGRPGSPEADPTVTADYILTGGADHVDDVRVDVTGDEATATGSARIWSNSAVVGAGATTVDRIAGTVRFTAHLVRAGSAIGRASSRRGPLPGRLTTTRQCRFSGGPRRTDAGGGRAVHGAGRRVRRPGRSTGPAGDQRGTAARGVQSLVVRQKGCPAGSRKTR